MKKIEYGTEYLDHLKDSVHDLFDYNKELRKEIERLKKKLPIDKHIKMSLMSIYGIRGSGKTAFEKLKEFNKLLEKAIIIKQEDNYVLCDMTKQELYEMIYKYRKEFLFKDV